MIAGMIDKVVLLAVRTAVEFSPQPPSAAGQDGLHGPAMGGKNLRAKLPLILRPMPVQYLGQFDHGQGLALAACRT